MVLRLYYARQTRFFQVPVLREREVFPRGKAKSVYFVFAIDNAPAEMYNSHCPLGRKAYAGIAHLVERRLAKAEVAGSSPVSRSNERMAFSHSLFRWSGKRGRWTMPCGGFEVQSRSQIVILTIRWMVKKALNGRLSVPSGTVVRPVDFYDSTQAAYISHSLFRWSGKRGSFARVERSETRGRGSKPVAEGNFDRPVNGRKGFERAALCSVKEHSPPRGLVGDDRKIFA